MANITRRSFLVNAAGAAASVELGRRLVSPAPALAAPAAAFPNVVVARGTNQDSMTSILKTALDGAGGIARFVKPGQTVAIKPNITWDYPPGTASSNEPEVVRALIQLVREAGAKRIIVLEHCTLSSAAECLRVSGIGAVLDETGVEKVIADRDVSPRDMFTQIEFPKAKIADFRKRGVLKAALDADVRINMGVAKSHLVTRLTMCLKHMMGFLEYPSALHAQLEQGLADLSSESRIQCQLHILEAIRVRLPVGNARQAGGYETEITNPRRIKRMNEIVVGTDPVLIDAYGCTNYFGYKPAELLHVKLAAQMGLGEMDVQKATDEGRLRIYKAGEAIATPTATPTPTVAATPTTAASSATPTATPVPGTPTPTTAPTAAATSTPLPTSTPGIVEPTPALPAVAGERGGQVTLNPNAFLSGALVPAAAVVAGVGVVVRRRLERDMAAGESEDAAEEAAEEADGNQ